MKKMKKDNTAGGSIILTMFVAVGEYYLHYEVKPLNLKLMLGRLLSTTGSSCNSRRARTD